MAQPARQLIRPRSLNNVMIAVSDLERSTAFYQRLFGTPVRYGEAVVFRISAGPQFFALTAVTSGSEGRICAACSIVAEFEGNSARLAHVRGQQLTRLSLASKIPPITL